MSQRNNDSYYNTLIQDSPVVRDHYSRFSRLAERTTISYQSILANSSHSLLNDSVQSTLNQPSVVNVSDAIPNINLSSTLQLPDESNDGAGNEDDSIRLAIFESFFELCQRYNLPQEIFELVDQFDQTCHENLLVNTKLLETKVRSNHETNYFSKFSSLVRLERNSWRLFKALMSDRILNENNFEKSIEMEIEEDMRLRLSDLELIERAIERNSMLREMQIVIDWLESIYDEDTVEKVDFYSDGPNYWENTLHSLKVAKGQNSFLNITKGRQYCNEMDPDASIRSGLPLHDLDKEDENRLFLYLFKLIRAGQLQEAKNIAERLGYFWLSASLEGWILHHDPNYNETLANDGVNNPSASPNSVHSMSTFNNPTLKQLQPVIGNPYRDLWKDTAWKCSKMEGTNVYERAIFAVFSGNRTTLLPLCTKWTDKLWAYFKCSLDVHLENILVDTNVAKPDLQPRNNIELPDAYWDNKLTSEEIFNEFDTQISGGLITTGGAFGTRLEEKYHQTIEKCLILGQVDKLVEHLYEWSKLINSNRERRTKQKLSQKDTKIINSKLILNNKFDSGNSEEEESLSEIVEPNLLRFFAHLVISIKQLGLVDEKLLELCIEVLEIYIGYLIEFKLVELIAYYTVYLPEPKQVKTFATLLESIDNTSDRKLCILIAKNAKLNVPAITSLVVDNIRSSQLSFHSLVSQSIPVCKFGQLAGDNNVLSVDCSKAKQLTSNVTDEDVRKINALDWLVLDEEAPQYVELLWQANALVRSFLLEQKLDQAWETFEKLPEDIVSKAYQQWKSCDHSLSFDIENVVREYFCDKAYFQASEAFQKWHHFLFNTKPKEPVKPKALNRLGDRVAYEQAVKQYEQELEAWNSQFQHQASVTSEKLLAFLCFPEGIWIDIENFDLVQEVNCDESSQQSQMDVEDNELMASEFLNSIGHDQVVKEQNERKQQDWSSRVGQLDGLRRIYVPQFVFLLHSVYSDSGNLQECLRIADILADEQRRLHSTFTRDQLSDLLAKLRESSIAILNEVSDPLGYLPA